MGVWTKSETAAGRGEGFHREGRERDQPAVLGVQRSNQVLTRPTLSAKTRDENVRSHVPSFYHTLPWQIRETAIFAGEKSEGPTLTLLLEYIELLERALPKQNLR